MARRMRLMRPPPPPDGKLWDNNLGWIPYERKVYAARYRLAYQAVPDWRDDPTYNLIEQVRAKKADKARRAATAAKRKATALKRKAMLVDRGCDLS